MRATYRLARWCWAASVLSALGLQAQDADVMNIAIKLRTGYTTQSKDNLSNNFLGFGFEYRYALSRGTIGAELGYFYKDGDPYLSPIGSAPAGMNPVDATRSGDSRRNQVEGFSMRLTYQDALSEDWSWQGGLMLGGTKFRHQYVGDVRSTGWGPSGSAQTTWRDTYQGTPEEGGFKVSPFAGVSWNMDKSNSLEFNLLLLNYTAIEYVHQPGTGDYHMSALGNLTTNNQFPQDSRTTHSRFVPHLEFAYAFHF